MDNFKFKVLEDEQFLKILSNCRYLKAVTINKVLVRNTLDHYNKEPLHDTYKAITGEPYIGTNKIWVDELYYNIKSYKEFFGLDITKNVMVTIEYFDIIAGKHSITYIV